MNSTLNPAISILMDSLHKLLLVLQAKDKKMNTLEALDYFKKNSNKGENCSYALKCKKLFINQEYDNIKPLILEVLEKIRDIEGNNFGR